MSNILADLIAKKYIARTDVKAVQYSNGNWSPHTKTGKHDGERIGWSRADLNAHIAGEKTFGHYLLNKDSNTKLFAFDIDLEKSGYLPTASMPEDESLTDSWIKSFAPVEDLRAAWLTRNHTGRAWMKLQFKEMAHMLMRQIETELEIQTVATYSGGKGVHVYGFTGLTNASNAREGAQIVLDSLGCFHTTRGVNFYKHMNTDPVDGYPNLSIELFPKQGNLDGKDLGNLLRLPLGRNLKSKDPTFFIDMRTPLGIMAPREPVEALSVRSPWE